MDKVIYTIFFSLLITNTWCQNKYCLDDSTTKSLYTICESGSLDTKVNTNTKFGSNSGNCKAAFINIQHRLNGKKVNLKDDNTIKIAQDLTRMDNGIYKRDRYSERILAEPKSDTSIVSLSNLKSIKKLDFCISDLVLDSLKDSVSGYCHFLLGVASRYHLFHVLAHIDTNNIVSYAFFDDFGVNGEEKSQNFTFVEEKVFYNYLKEFLLIAAHSYSLSTNLKNAATIYGKKYKPGDRPLTSEIYLFKNKD